MRYCYIKEEEIEKAQDHFYYENDDGSYSLIKNETNFVFDLIWENKHYYFATFKDATNYLYEIIKNKTIKVGFTITKRELQIYKELIWRKEPHKVFKV